MKGGVLGNSTISFDDFPSDTSTHCPKAKPLVSGPVLQGGAPQLAKHM